MSHKELFLAIDIFNSDDDSDIVEDIFAGFDEAFNLVVLLEYTDYQEPKYNHCSYATMTKDEAYRLAQRLRIPMTKIPAALAETVSDYDRIINPTLDHTRRCYKDILSFLMDNGAHLKQERP